MQRYKTFSELGLDFSEGSGCHSCKDMSCHNNVPSKIDGLEYNVHISMNPDRTEFTVHATPNSTTFTHTDIEANFEDEQSAVGFVCNLFEWFRCF